MIQIISLPLPYERTTVTNNDIILDTNVDTHQQDTDLSFSDLVIQVEKLPLLFSTDIILKINAQSWLCCIIVHFLMEINWKQLKDESVSVPIYNCCGPLN